MTHLKRFTIILIIFISIYILSQVQKYNSWMHQLLLPLPREHSTTCYSLVLPGKLKTKTRRHSPHQLTHTAPLVLSNLRGCLTMTSTENALKVRTNSYSDM